MKPPPTPKGIVGYASGVGAEDQRERIASALAQAGLSAVEIVVEHPRSGTTGREGLAKVYEYVGRSDIDTLVVASYDAVLQDPLSVDRWRRDMAFKYGVRVVEVG